MNASIITSKGQVTVPVELRRALGLRAGDRLIFELDDDGLKVHPVRKGSAKKLRGRISSGRGFPGRDEVREEVAEALGAENEK